MTTEKDRPEQDGALIEEIKRHGLVVTENGYIRWDSKNPKHPRNWKSGRKLYNTLVILCLEFVTYVSASFVGSQCSFM
jgi:hypothetical protein